MECDLLAGERRPSYTEKGQIKNWKVLHIRFIEPSTARPDAPSKSGNSRLNPLKPSVMTASMPLNLMSKLGKLITPKTDFVTFTRVVFCQGHKMAQTTSTHSFSVAF